MDLLRKEKELLELKRKQLDKELHEQRNKEVMFEMLNKECCWG